MAKVREQSRSKIMSSIGRRDTKPELVVRKELWARGVRGYRVDVSLPGRPDLYFPRFRLCIFIDGCFWHACPLHFKEVSSNKEYWGPKIARNKKRDLEINRTLRDQGFAVARFWEHDVASDNGKKVVDQVERIIHDLVNGKA